MLHGIHQTLDSLSRAERTVGEWIVAHPREATTATVGDIATATGVSEPTVVRFCRSVGANGFREFKLRLAEACGSAGSFVHSDVNPSDSIEDAVHKVVDRSIQTLTDLRGRLASLPFTEAVDRLAKARQILFAGLGASGEVARDAHQKFFRLGIPCAIATDAPTLLQMASIAAPADVCIAISNTGQWQSLASAMHRASRNGALVVALTADSSPLASAADLVFPGQITEDTSVFTPMSSRLSHLVTLDALQVALAIHLGPSAEARLRATKSALGGATGH
ncbi:MAG: MurR/RpiR family transcriptional regulator [Pseudomonadota bacterium]